MKEHSPFHSMHFSTLPTFSYFLKGSPHQGVYLIYNTESNTLQVFVMAGESHDLRGNSTEFIDSIIQLLKDTPINVEIMTEIPFYETTQQLSRSHNSKDQTKSNFRKILQKFESVLSKQSIPKSTDLESKQKIDKYYQRMIHPYQGRLRLWATDIRSVPFWYFLIDYLNIVINNKLKQKSKELWRKYDVKKKYLIYLLILDDIHNPIFEILDIYLVEINLGVKKRHLKMNNIKP